MPTRRRTDPLVTQQIWDAIKMTINQKNVANNERIAKSLSRSCAITESEAQEQLNMAINDGLVVPKKTSSKGAVEQSSYKLPIGLDISEDRDWYCYKCHKAGCVESCQQCHRVYHSECHRANTEVKKICHFCEKINVDDTSLEKNDLNRILGFTCGHLKAKLPPEITNRTIVCQEADPTGGQNEFHGPTWIGVGEDAWRAAVLVSKHMDLVMMESKTNNKQYQNLSEFEADAHNILHNIVVYHGAHSVIAEMGLEMYQDCCYDLQEIRRCADCYRISNEKSEKMWFCLPCNPPHQLVYAKQKGYPYWPAKVMRVHGNQYDVRFFGGHHMRANIEKSFIRPIATGLQSLQIKRSTAWNRAFEELKYHQNLLEKLAKKRLEPMTINGRRNEDGPTPAKIRYEDASFMKNMKNQIFKDLRVQVERLGSEGHLESQQPSNNANPLSRNKRIASKASSEERQVPHLPVAEDEPAADLSSMSPQGLRKEGSQEDTVTSSSQEPRTKCVLVQTEQIQTDADAVPAKIKRERRTSEQPTTTAVEKLRRDFELDKCRELERLQAEHAKELRQTTDKHQQSISEIKKKQWCYNCEAEAIYHCCWNTAYCSTDCQQLHWQREHKRVCRRKR